MLDSQRLQIELIKTSKVAGKEELGKIADETCLAVLENKELKRKIGELQSTIE